MIASLDWRIMDKQREKVGQCLTNDDLIVDVVDKNKEVKYDFLWGTVLLKIHFGNL